MSFRICTVPYFNTLPLTWFLDRYLPGMRMTRDYPANLAAALDSKQVDIAMMPVASLATLPGSRIISNAAIACSGAVRSVMLYARKPLDEICVLALDCDSRTSVTLAQVLLREYWHNDDYAIRPLERQMSLDAISPEIDACVVIGDKALLYSPQREIWPEVHDLGSLWQSQTGFPFVFAAWVTTADDATMSQWKNDGIINALEQARDDGVKRLPEIVAETLTTNASRGYEASPLLTPELLESYYRNNIVYRLSDAHHAGLQRFFELANKHGLLPVPKR